MLFRFMVAFCLALGSLPGAASGQTQDDPHPFGDKFPRLDHLATGAWWETPSEDAEQATKKQQAAPRRIIDMDVPRDQVVAFALYTHDHGVLKMTAQLFPLMPEEERIARLELHRDGQWREVARTAVLYPGWSAHFRIAPWDNRATVKYRVRHGEQAWFEGVIRADPQDKEEIVVGALSCNSSRTSGPRPQIVANLQRQNPDLLFFAGDQSYHHTEHTAGWLQFGLQFREVLKDRPVITIPDDHDVGQPNLWGEEGKVSTYPGASDGGYAYPASYVKMVERCQTWHLPDPVDPRPVGQGIGVYFTHLRVGGVDFAILEDRKFKSGPQGKIPEMGPRPDHIVDPSYDRQAVDLDGLQLLGDRQLTFLHQWGQDWSEAEMKCVLSQTAFCGAVHLHGSPENRLLADLDCNGWPQTGRRKALVELRRALATHICGDQHLAVVVQHGIDQFNDGPYAFTTPAIVNTIYGRWWHPLPEEAGADAVADSPLPWTGDYEDGLGNKIRMLAYANPEDPQDERKRADGYGLVRFHKKTRSVTFECWSRFADVAAGQGQFPGWPIEFSMFENDGRRPTHELPEVRLPQAGQVIQVVQQANNEILYTFRLQGREFHPHVYAEGSYVVKYGADQPDRVLYTAAATPVVSSREKTQKAQEEKE